MADVTMLVRAKVRIPIPCVHLNASIDFHIPIPDGFEVEFESRTVADTDMLRAIIERRLEELSPGASLRSFRLPPRWKHPWY